MTDLSTAEPTPEQIEQMELTTAEWRVIGEATDKADLEKCKLIIPRVYQAAGLEPPREVLLADGPIAAAKLARQLDQEVDKEHLGRPLRDYVSDQVYGNHDAPWLAFYYFFLHYCKMEVCEPLRPLMDLARNSGWWAPYDTRAIVQHKCSAFRRNAADQLHCEDGPSVEWPDGTKLWDINGIEVDEQIVLRPDTQTIEQIMGEENGDVRSLRIERFGWPRFLKETKSDVIDRRKNVIEGTMEALFRSPTGENRFVCTCPTGRIFAMGVPTEITSCVTASEWLSAAAGTRIIART